MTTTKKARHVVIHCANQEPEPGIVFNLWHGKENAKGELMDSWPWFTTDPQEAEDYFKLPANDSESYSVVAYEIPEGVDYGVVDGKMDMDEDLDIMKEIGSWEFYRSRNLKESHGEVSDEEKDEAEMVLQKDNYMNWWWKLKSEKVHQRFLANVTKKHGGPAVTMGPFTIVKEGANIYHVYRFHVYWTNRISECLVCDTFDTKGFVKTEFDEEEDTYYVSFRYSLNGGEWEKFGIEVPMDDGNYPDEWNGKEIEQFRKNQAVDQAITECLKATIG